MNAKIIIQRREYTASYVSEKIGTLRLTPGLTRTPESLLTSIKLEAGQV